MRISDWSSDVCSSDLSNWKAMPLGYHARSGTVTGPNADIRRPNGQYRSAGTVVTGASRALDFELEIGIILSSASALGERVAAEAFQQPVFGLTLLNDWSARDTHPCADVTPGPCTDTHIRTPMRSPGTPPH